MKRFSDLIEEANRSKKEEVDDSKERSAALTKVVQQKVSEARNTLTSSDMEIVTALRDNRSYRLTLFEMTGLGGQIGLEGKLSQVNVSINALRAIPEYQSVAELLEELAKAEYPIVPTYSVCRHSDPPADTLKIELVIQSLN